MLKCALLCIAVHCCVKCCLLGLLQALQSHDAVLSASMALWLSYVLCLGRIFPLADTCPCLEPGWRAQHPILERDSLQQGMPRRLQELDKTTSAFQMDLNTVKHSLRDLPAEVAEQLAALVEGWVPYLAVRRCFKAPASPCSFLGVGWFQDITGSTREQRIASRHCLSRAYLWVTMQVMACSPLQAFKCV